MGKTVAICFARLYRFQSSDSGDVECEGKRHAGHVRPSL